MKFVLEIDVSHEKMINTKMPEVLGPAVKVLMDVLARDATFAEVLKLTDEHRQGKPDDLVLVESGLVGCEDALFRLSVSEAPFNNTAHSAENPDAYTRSSERDHPKNEAADEARH